jgi:hypothetical protein
MEEVRERCTYFLEYSRLSVACGRAEGGVLLAQMTREGVWTIIVTGIENISSKQIYDTTKLSLVPVGPLGRCTGW